MVAARTVAFNRDPGRRRACERRLRRLPVRSDRAAVTEGLRCASRAVPARAV